MGRLTKTQIISQALAKHGNTANTSPAADWFDDVLDELYSSKQWSFLIQRAQSLTFSARTATCPTGFLTSSRVTRVLNQSATHLVKKPITWIEQESKRYTSTAAPRFYSEDDSTDPAKIVLEVSPDQSYTWDMDWTILPARLALGGTPIFPSDRILIQAVFVEALRQQPVQGKNLEAEEGKLEAMIARRFRGESMEDQADDEMKLDDGVFSLGSTRSSGARWYSSDVPETV